MYKVIKNFRDKYTGIMYKAGDVVDFTPARVNEILEVGNLIEKTEEITPVEKEEGRKILEKAKEKMKKKK